MSTKRLVALATLMAVLLGGSLHPLPAAAEGTATIVSEHADRTCAGDRATLRWEPPAGVEDLVAFEITRFGYTYFPSSTTTTIGAGARSLDFTVSFFLNSFTIRTVTSGGVTSEPFASASIIGSQAPFAMEWDHHVSPGDVGDGFAAVRFAWAGPVKAVTVGASSPVVRLTAAPGGETVEIPAVGSGVAHTFPGLTNGVAYTFTADTFNACGSSSSSPSAAYVPGVRPSWVAASPPLTVKKNKSYSYQFEATGNPAPSYRLIAAPSWLSVSSGGLITGEPPKEVTTFSFSVAAENGVGIDYPGAEAPVVAGPFAVTVVKGSREA